MQAGIGAVDAHSGTAGLAWILSCACLISACLSSALLTGCATVSPPQSHWATANARKTHCEVNPVMDRGCRKGTPEVWQHNGLEQFRIHFVEFDDQGWLHETPSHQINSVMEDLSKTLGDTKKKLQLVVFVHGWKHSAADNDRDVIRMRQLLLQMKAAERQTGNDKATEFVGVYVGWRGQSWGRENRLSDMLLNLTFWTRKATAIRVAQGEVRELFARIRGLQEYWNGEKSSGCGADSGRESNCKFKTLIVGHSFGAWIVYAAVAQSIVETLAMDTDLPKQVIHSTSDSAAEETKRRQRARPADMVVLVNPAFEAVRYAVVHKAAHRNRRSDSDLPVLVSITSTADDATGTWFPRGRAVNILFEKLSTEDQKKAVLRTPGHADMYLTHELSTEPVPCRRWRETLELDAQGNLKSRYDNAEQLKEQLEANAAAEKTQADESRKEGSRSFCGDLQLSPLNRDTPNPGIWNIRTFKNVIPNHSDFMTPPFINFMRQLYAETTR